MEANKNKTLSFLASKGLVLIVASFLVILPAYALAQVTVHAAADAADNNLNAELDAKRAALEELKKKTELYQENIKTKEQEALTLQNQMALIDLQIQQNETDVETIKTEMEAINLELQKLDSSIAEKTQTLNYNKELLAEYLRIIYKNDQQSYLDVIMSNKSFSDFFDHMQYTQTLEGDVANTVKTIKADKDALEQDKSSKEAKKKELTDLMDKLSASLTVLDGQKQYKTDLLDETKNSQAKFEELLEAARQEEAAAQADVSNLESKARDQLQEKGIDLNVDATLMWPVSPAKGISATFHDPTYIFKKLFQHPAIDIRVGQGTAVRAADNGYVVRAKNAGMGYSYIMIVHNNQISTVYGHMSRIDVDEDNYVVRGQQIGLSGGMPGTPGAGGLTTGPHLHFEVRSDGIPVNPLDYLPSL